MSKNLTLPTPTFLGWLLLGLTTFFYAFQNLIRVSPSVMAPHIMNDFSINAADFGQFSSAYYLGYALMHIPFGLAFDRFKLRYVLSFSIALSVLGILPLILNTSWQWVLLGRFLVGAGSSGAILSLFKVFRDYFPSHWFSRLLGWAATLGVLGSIYGSHPIDVLQEQMGYQTILGWFLGVGLVLSIIAILLAQQTTPQTFLKNHDMVSELKSVFQNKTILLICLFGGFLVGPLEGFADVWALPFLETIYQFDRTTASSLPSLIYIGFSIGCPLMAILGERLKMYYGLTILSAFIMMLLFLLMFITQPSYWMVGFMFLMIGIMSGYQVLTMTLNVQNAHPEQAGLVTAVTNMIIMSFGSFFHSGMGQLTQYAWDGKLNSAGSPIYNATAYIWGTSMIPVMACLGGLGFMYLLHKQSRIKDGHTTISHS